MNVTSLKTLTDIQYMCNMKRLENAVRHKGCLPSSETGYTLYIYANTFTCVRVYRSRAGTEQNIEVKRNNESLCLIVASFKTIY